MKKLILFSSLLVLLACKKSDETTTPATTDDGDGTTTNNFSRLYAKMYNVTSVDSSGNTNIIIKTTDVPDHKSPFFGSGNAKYEAYNGDNPDFSTTVNLGGMMSDPTILSQSITFTIPRFPVLASSHTSTTGGPIGIARNGVAIYNQYNGNGSALDALEINNADQYLGHPTPTAAGAQYHYHYEPKYLTTTYGNTAFMGFLLDGFPVYGSYENGVKITSDMLDSYHGHVSATEDYPNDKIYHYHVVSGSSSKANDLKLAAPYINGGKYYGTKGTVN